MSLEHVAWRYVGSQTFATATVAAVLDALYTLGTKATYYDASTRTQGSGSAWTYTGNRYQNAGTTEALYPAPPTNTLTQRVLVAGAATLPTPSPTAASPDSTAANTLMVNIVKNAGAYNAWNAASPMTSGTTFGYWRVWPTTAGTGTVYLWEGKDVMMVIITTSTGTSYGFIAGAILDPETTDASDGESDGKLYGLIVSGTTAVISTAFFSTADFLTHSGTASAFHAAVFTPGGSTLLTMSPVTNGRTAMTTTGLRTRAGQYARVPFVYRYTAAAPNDRFAGRLREVFMFSDSQTPRVQTNGATTIGYVVGASSVSDNDAILLEHA
jgi:hypothetical protein